MKKLTIPTILTLLLSPPLSPSPSASFTKLHILLCNAKEIVATNEWQILKDGDTIPKGLHVRIDMTTGLKMVKLISDDNDDDTEDESGAKNDNKKVWTHASVTEGGALSIIDTDRDDESNINNGGGGTIPKITQLTSEELRAGLTPETSQRINDALLNQARKEDIEKKLQQEKDLELKRKKMASIASLDDFSNAGDTATNKDEADYVMMHRTLSNLPQDVRDTMIDQGKLTPLPDPLTASDDEIAKYRSYITKLWNVRQDLLRKLDEEYIENVPDILKEHISSLEKYINKLRLDDDVLEEEDISDMLNVLDDLEYHLADLDLARDFHTMGGWPLLAALLLPHEAFIAASENSNGTISTTTNTVYNVNSSKGQHYNNKVRAKVAWCIGTAVKNIQEFHSWAIEDLRLYVPTSKKTIILWSYYSEQQQPVTVLSLLLDSLLESTTVTESNNNNKNDQTLLWQWRIKGIYALGSLLRGNNEAITSFIDYSITASPLAILAHSAVIETSDDNNALSISTLMNVQRKNKYRFASKMVTLLNDLLLENNDQLNKIITTPLWCIFPIMILENITEGKGENANLAATSYGDLLERTLQAILNMEPLCRYTEGNNNNNDGKNHNVLQMRLLATVIDGYLGDNIKDASKGDERLAFRDLRDSLILMVTKEGGRGK